MAEQPRQYPPREHEQQSAEEGDEAGAEKRVPVRISHALLLGQRPVVLGRTAIARPDSSHTRRRYRAGVVAAVHHCRPHCPDFTRRCLSAVYDLLRRSRRPFRAVFWNSQQYRKTHDRMALVLRRQPVNATSSKPIDELTKRVERCRDPAPVPPIRSGGSIYVRSQLDDEHFVVVRKPTACVAQHVACLEFSAMQRRPQTPGAEQSWPCGALGFSSSCSCN